jgi:hypothetical protein
MKRGACSKVIFARTALVRGKNGGMRGDRKSSDALPSYLLGDPKSMNPVTRRRNLQIYALPLNLFLVHVPTGCSGVNFNGFAARR